MGLTFKLNTAQLEVSIRQHAERAVKGASDKMRRQAIKIRDLARQYAPRDDGDLEDAIQMMTQKDGSNRNVFIVYLDPDHPAGLNKTVGDYGLLIERGMAPYGSGKYHLGPESIAKGGKVGGRFIKRAFDEVSKTVAGEIGIEVKRVLGGGRGLVSNNAALKSERDYGGEE